MDGDADLAAAAALIGGPTRAALLLALMEEEPLPARELAVCAGIAPSTASEQLAQLVDGDLLMVERRGRQRWFRLADPAVAVALEALSAIAPLRPVRSLREANAGEAIRQARTCYDHLAGVLGVALAAALEREGVLVYDGDGDGYALGPQASAWLGDLGIDVAHLSLGRRPLVRPCLDWSERRRHVAGAVGAALTARLSSSAGSNGEPRTVRWSSLHWGGLSYGHSSGSSCHSEQRRRWIESTQLASSGC